MAQCLGKGRTAKAAFQALKGFHISNQLMKESAFLYRHVHKKKMKKDEPRVLHQGFNNIKARQWGGKGDGGSEGWHKVCGLQVSRTCRKRRQSQVSVEKFNSNRSGSKDEKVL